MSDSIQHDDALHDPDRIGRATEPSRTFRRALVFGATGQIGDALLPLLYAKGVAVRAVSRRPQPAADAPGLQWIRSDLEQANLEPANSGSADSYGSDRSEGCALLPRDCDVIFSLGPLDAFARWQDRAGPIAPRVVAFGSTSVRTKDASTDHAERELATRLRAAEDSLLAFGARHRIAVSILRPTLVYGCGRDRTLSRIAALARRHGVFMLPSSAIGLRQPVHVDDLAAAAVACARQAQCADRAYDVPGGEAVGYREMVSRVLGSLQPKPRLLTVPDWLFRATVRVANALGTLGDAGRGVVDRLDQDLVFDADPAHRDFGYAPRAFQCDRAMFGSGQ
ncbi:MAG: nucleoside-diphosphate sugar epimerase [Lysobacteraceae bacterium]